MDTAPAAEVPDVKAGIAYIKANMPETYKSIRAKAAEIGNLAYSLVRRALAGEANCFYACERGHVIGQPVTAADIDAEVARMMVRFGSTHVCIWGPAVVQPKAEATDGAH